MLSLQDPMDLDRIDSLVADVILRLCYQKPVELCDRGEGFVKGPEDELCNLLMSNLDGPLDIGTLCEGIGTNRYNISQRFSKIYGYTPYAFHKHLRLIKAGAEIAFGDKTMREVSESVGYGTENKFADAFRREFGCRPRGFASVVDGAVHPDASARDRYAPIGIVCPAGNGSSDPNQLGAAPTGLVGEFRPWNRSLRRS